MLNQGFLLQNMGALHLYIQVVWTSTYIIKKQSEKSWLLINSISDYITVEKLTPPLNVTVNCTEASHGCEIRWQPPHTSHVKRRACFKYEIVIENKVRITMTLNSILNNWYPVLPYLTNLSFLICSIPLAHELRTAVTHKQGQQTEGMLSVHCTAGPLRNWARDSPHWGWIAILAHTGGQTILADNLIMNSYRIH